MSMFKEPGKTSTSKYGTKFRGGTTPGGRTYISSRERKPGGVQKTTSVFSDKAYHEKLTTPGSPTVKRTGTKDFQRPVKKGPTKPVRKAK